MTDAWPALMTFVFLGMLLVAIIRYRVNAFLALLVVSLGLGLAAGMTPLSVVDAMKKGVGDVLREVAILLALGAILGRLLEASGAAEVIARTLISSFGEKRAPLACLLTGLLVGIPVLFNVAFLLLVPIAGRLQRQTGQSLLWFLLPLTFSLGLTHSLVPPKPGIIAAVHALGGPDQGKAMVQTIVFGALLCLPMMLVGWYGPGRLWAQKQFVAAPSTAGDTAEQPAKSTVSFGLALVIVTLPVLLSVVGFSAGLLSPPPPRPTEVKQAASEAKTPPPKTASAPALDWLKFVGSPTIAMLLTTLFALYFLGIRRGQGAAQVEKLVAAALVEVGGIVFLFGAAGAFKEVIEATGAGKYISDRMRELPLPPLVSAYLVAVLMRLALGSATASVLLASALLASLAETMPGEEIFLVLSVACGVTFATQPADSGFWMVKELGNLSVRDVMVPFNICKIVMSLTGLAVLLIAKALLF